MKWPGAGNQIPKTTPLSRYPAIPLLILYAASLLWLSVGTPGTFISPDENAAFTFAEVWRNDGELAVAEELNTTLGGIVHPRSVVAVGGALVPGSFFGMPLLAGTIGRFVGAHGMLLVTPFLAVLAVLAWRSVVYRLFGDNRLATLAAVALAVFPPFWYYAARSMMHNVAFVAFLIFGAWFVIAKPFSRVGENRSRRLLEFLFAGICVGIALMMRTAEVIWVVAAVGGLFAAKQSAISNQRTAATHLPSTIYLVTAFASGAIMMLALLALVQASVYGSPFVNGYTVQNAVSAAPQEVQFALAETPAETIFEKVGAVLLPFGFHEFAIAKNVWHFGLALFPWMTVLAAVGIASSQWPVARRQPGSEPLNPGHWPLQKKTWRVLLTLLVVLAAWLGVVYGSWSFNDNPDPFAVTLADSHVRYWLPLFVLATPFIALALQKLTTRKAWLLVPVTAAVVVLSWSLVFLGDDGLLASRKELFESAAKRDAVLLATEETSIVIVDRADKFLWPHRSVVVPLRSESTFAAMPDMVALGSVYYFGIPFPADDLAHLNDVQLAPLGLRIDIVAPVDDEALYRISPR